MKLKKYTLLVIATIALFGLLGWSGYAQKSSGRVAWEYKEVAVALSDQQLNALGADGWEMVGFSFDVNSAHKLMYFKRPSPLRAR